MKVSGEKRLVILDDYFPNVKTGFRIAEYNYYLDKFPKSVVYSFNRDFDSLYNEYISYYPRFKDRVFKFDNGGEFHRTISNCDLCYTVFLTNAFNYMWIFDEYKKPFVFTLYPGGGFNVDTIKTMRQMKALCKSNLLKKVIATQKITYNYILGNSLLPPDRYELIYGVATHPDLLEVSLESKKLLGKTKETFDICFVANKYMPKGIDKGYDVFIEVCKNLYKLEKQIRFHVVGGFSEREIDISEIKDRIFFYGMQNNDFFKTFYIDKDLILSPNIPFALFRGAFDGFPTGCCVDAALNGTAVLCTDELNLNTVFEDGKHLRIVKRNTDHIVEIILDYYKNPSKIYAIASEGQKKFREVFGLDSQMERRTSILEQYM